MQEKGQEKKKKNFEVKKHKDTSIIVILSGYVCPIHILSKSSVSTWQYSYTLIKSHNRSHHNF